MESSGGSTPSAHAGSSQGGSSSAMPDDLDSFFEAEVSGICQRLFRCQEGSDDFTAARLLLETPAGCEDHLRRINAQSPQIADLHQQLAAGALHYDAAMAAKCVAELAECNGPDAFTEADCREVFDGDAAVGEACHRDEDCAGDAYCDALGTCPGQCQARKASGEVCEQARECAYTGGVVFCDRDSGPEPMCRTLLPATAKSGEGEPCTRLLTGAEELLTCQDELWCAPVADPEAAMGECAKPIAGDGPCSDGDDVCAEGYCASAVGQCVPYVVLKQVGDACDKEQLLICDPRLGLKCNETTAKCEGSGDGTLDSACFSGDFQRGCDPGLYCQRADEPLGTCVPHLEAGEACESGNQCASGSCSIVCEERYCQ